MRGTRALVVTLAAAAALAGAGCDRRAGAPVTAPTGVAPTSGTPAAPTGTPGASVSPTTAPTPSRTTTAPGRPTGSPTGKPTVPTRPAGYDPTRDITDLVVQTDGLTLDRPRRGIRHGDLVVTIRNKGPHPVWGMRFVVELPESMTADGGDWTGCTPLRSQREEYPAGSLCDKGYLGVGETRVYRLGVQSPASQDGNDSRVSRWLVDVWSSGPGEQQCQDRAPADNRRIFLVRRG